MDIIETMKEDLEVTQVPDDCITVVDSEEDAGNRLAELMIPILAIGAGAVVSWESIIKPGYRLIRDGVGYVIKGFREAKAAKKSPAKVDEIVDEVPDEIEE